MLVYRSCRHCRRRRGGSWGRRSKERGAWSMEQGERILTPSSLLRAPCCYTRGMPRFVLLYHECPPDYVRESHWDFMLEAAGVLRTWAVAKLPRSWRAAWEKTAALHPDCPVLADF